LKVALYARVSRIDKDQTPENQLLILRKYAQDRGLEPFREYVDYASGGTPERPEFKQLMVDARSHRFRAIVIVRIDRIMRSTLHFVNLLEELDNIGVVLISADLQIDTSTPTGKLMRVMTSAIAEFERELLSLRTKEGLERARAQGKRLGKPPSPEITERCLSLRESGLSYNEIGNELNMTKEAVKQRIHRGKTAAGVTKTPSET